MYKRQDLQQHDKVVAALIAETEEAIRVDGAQAVSLGCTAMVDVAEDVQAGLLKNCLLYTSTGQDMVVEPVHGGLECGAFFEKNPHLDMIAIGPSLTDVHSPDESCDIESIQVTAALITRILERLT